MLAYHRRPVSLSFISTDLPILSTIETAATLYQKDRQSFHLLLHQSDGFQPAAECEPTCKDNQDSDTNRLLWLEIAPSRVIMTMQGNTQFAYRHFWEQGIYGVSRYWLNSNNTEASCSFRLRNYTRSLQLEGYPLLKFLRVEYELWTGQVQLGHYVLHLEIYH
jgi:hypothetical protein